MTDAPPADGAPGEQSGPAWKPSGIRRSSFTPPADAESPTFDDDALADAMAAEVSTYTSEIKLPVLPPPAGAEFGSDAPAQPAVVDQDAPVVGGVTSADETELSTAIGGASTLEAMERLEDEFRRISNGEPPSIEVPRSQTRPVPSPFMDPPPVFDATRFDAPPPAANSFGDVPLVGLALTDVPSPPAAQPTSGPPSASPVLPETPGERELEEDPFAWLESVATPRAVASRESLIPRSVLDVPVPEGKLPPLPGSAALGWNKPEAEPTPEPVDPPAAPAHLGTVVWSPVPHERDEPDTSTRAFDDRPAEVVPDQSVFDIPLPAATEVARIAAPVAFPSLAPTADTASMSFPGLLPVDRSLMEPDAVAAAAATAAALAESSPLATVAPPSGANAEPPADGVWDLGTSSSASDTSVNDTDVYDTDVYDTDVNGTDLDVSSGRHDAERLLPNAAIAAAAAAAAATAASVPAPLQLWRPPAVEAAPPTRGVAIPISTEPPVGPESPDWLDAPPPVYTPPELVDPPPFTDATANPALDPVSPITAQTMSRLPTPIPTQRPNVEDRAQLPPPAGYDDIPILSSDAASQASTVASMFFAPAAPLEPLLPVPPSASPVVAFPLSPFVGETESSTLDDDDDDVIDDLDRVSGSGAGSGSTSAGVVNAVASLDGAVAPGGSEGQPISPLAVTPLAVSPLALSPLAEPIATPRVADDQRGIADQVPTSPPAFEIETAGLEPTLLERRAGRAARLFWLWFAANSSVVSMGLGAVLLGTGISLRQSIVATLAGVAISFLPLGLGTLAGKWSGQPTMVVSRATFGHLGNVIPSLLAVITRVFFGAVLLWLLATAVAEVLVGAGLDAGLGTTLWQLIGLVAGFAISTTVAVFGYGLLAKLQLVLSVVNGLLILGAAALTFQRLDVTKALMIPDGSWLLSVGGAAIVFAVIGLAWVHSSSDLARYQRPGSSGATSMLWATFGATLPPFVLICWGALLAASDSGLAKQLQTNPLAAIASLLPSWYPAPLLAAAALGLLSAAVLTIYSGGFAVQAVGVRMRRSIATLVAALLVLATAGALVFVAQDFASIVRGLIITIAVPVAAWAGIFAAEMMIRTRRFHAQSLLQRGGLYPQVRWVNLIAFLLISALGYGFVTSTVTGFRWEGFLFAAIGVAPADPLGASNIGVFVALVLGLIVPLASGVSAIRRQEAAVPDGVTAPGSRLHAQASDAASTLDAPVLLPSSGPVVTPAPAPWLLPNPSE